MHEVHESAVEPSSASTSDAGVFGRRLQSERARLGLTQSQLADVLGVSRVTFAKYESGKTAPDLPTLARGAHAAGLDLEYLVTGGRSRLGADIGWNLIRRTLTFIRGRLVARGQDISPEEEAEILRDLYLIVAGSLEDASAPSALHGERCGDGRVA